MGNGIDSKAGQDIQTAQVLELVTSLGRETCSLLGSSEYCVGFEWCMTKTYLGNGSFRNFSLSFSFMFEKGLCEFDKLSIWCKSLKLCLVLKKFEGKCDENKIKWKSEKKEKVKKIKK